MKNPLSIKNQLFGNYENVEINKEYYFKKLKSPDWVDRFVFGISESERGFATFDPLTNAGALFFGATGSGKSQGMKFSVYTHYMVNGHNTLYVLFDAAKDAGDYKELKKFKDNVVVAIKSTSKFNPLMDYVWAEYKARTKELGDVDAPHIYAYDRMMKKKDPKIKPLARLFLIFEEFHVLIDDPQVMLARNLDRPETAAGKMKMLARLARSAGIYLFIATQRATSDDIPSDIKPWIKIPVGFRVSTAHDANAVGLDKATEIPAELPGRCVYSSNLWMQYPYIPDDSPFYENLLKEFKKPFNARLLSFKVADMQTALSGDNADNYVFVKPFTEIVKGHDQFSKKLISKRFLEEFGFIVEEQINNGYYAKQIASRDGKKYVVYNPPDIPDSDGYNRGLRKSTIENVTDSVSELGCDALIAFSFDDAASDLQDHCSSGGIYVDHDELLKMANILDNKDSFNEASLTSKLRAFKLHPSYVPKDGDSDDSEEIQTRPFSGNNRRRRPSNF